MFPMNYLFLYTCLLVCQQIKYQIISICYILYELFIFIYLYFGLLIDQILNNSNLLCSILAIYYELFVFIYLYLVVINFMNQGQGGKVSITSKEQGKPSRRKLVMGSNDQKLFRFYSSSVLLSIFRLTMLQRCVSSMFWLLLHKHAQQYS